MVKLGCRIYYQDTDSMHIRKEDIQKLANEFERKYNKKLIGSDLGQFHSDFTTDDGKTNVLNAVESLFLMKKTYIDKLILNDASYGYMSRAKGVPFYTREIKANEDFKGSMWKLYKYLYKGKSLEFDLCKGHPQFKMNKNMTIQNRVSFPKTIKTTYEEGKEEEYFHQEQDDEEEY